MEKKKLRSVLIVLAVFLFCTALLACSPRAGTEGPVASDPVEGADGGDGASTAAFTWTTDSDCSACHDNSTTTLANLTCEAAQGEPNTTCMTCHADPENVEAAHAELTLADTDGDPNRLKESKVPAEECLTCHNQEELVTATAELTVLTDSRDTTVNPHEVMTTKNIGGAHDQIQCSNCHKMHSEKETTEIASDYCLSCHHDNVYDCYICHS